MENILACPVFGSFQTGYLTIKKHEDETNVLSYPNREVENAFLYNLVEEFSGK
ncbi:MAG: hypothetical protein NT166_00405 [Candidatus Aminicenantes bacterium]|nr:hypothetical protein [Candidatus Aminicenantes bacterium]